MTAALAASATAAAQAGPAITLTTPGTRYDGTQFTLGFEFTVTASETIRSLGVFDDGQNGIGQSAMVGLWDTSGNLLAQATIPAGSGSALIGDFRYIAITPFMLMPGTQYVIGAYLAGNMASSLGTGQGGTGSVDPNVLITEDRFSDGSKFAFADKTDNHPGGAWLGANFTDQAVAAVPEPATLALLVSGIAGLGAARRRRKQ